ncbi:MAG TPA: hypothetical protein VGI42_00210 [Chthoniobacterales bacterium]
MFDQLEVYDDAAPRSPALNMALDEALLESAVSPILRFYRWRRPAVSFGYFGFLVEAKDQARDREIIRRWTGGGIVPHGKDLTYSVIIPAAHLLFVRSSLAIYADLHDAIRQALRENGIEAALASSAAPKISGDCFANPVRADLISDGRKIAGAAHRRSRAGLLHQGSIQRPSLPERFKHDLARILCAQFEIRSLSQTLLERAGNLVESKYGTAGWLARR